MGFDLAGLLAARRGQGYELHARYLNPQLPRMLHAIGFDKVYERAEGAYLYDREGNRHADFLAGFGVFGLGRNHPVVRRALRDVLDGELADMVQFDCGDTLRAARHGLFAQMVVVTLFQRHHILIQVVGDHMEVIKLLPPLTIGAAEVKLFSEAFADVMEEAHRGTGLMWDFGRTLVKQAMTR